MPLTGISLLVRFFNGIIKSFRAYFIFNLFELPCIQGLTFLRGRYIIKAIKRKQPDTREAIKIATKKRSYSSIEPLKPKSQGAQPRACFESIIIYRW